MKQRVYIDTSVIGGCFDREFEVWSNRLFPDLQSGSRIAVVSDVTIDELSDAPLKVQKVFTDLPESVVEFLVCDDECRTLARKYILDNAVTAKYYEDALHIAIASVNHVHVLASWNFKHIVNLERIRRYNSVNLKNGYHSLEIRTPREILSFGNYDD